MMFFRKRSGDPETENEKCVLQQELLEAKEKLKKSRDGWHKKKVIGQSKTGFELVLDGLLSGRIREEDL